MMFYYLLNYIESPKKTKTKFQLGHWADLGILENTSDTVRTNQPNGMMWFYQHLQIWQWLVSKDVVGHSKIFQNALIMCLNYSELLNTRYCMYSSHNCTAAHCCIYDHLSPPKKIKMAKLKIMKGSEDLLSALYVESTVRRGWPL